LKAIIPKAFQSPRDYVIQKTTGVYSFNRVAAELARQRPQALQASSKEIEPFLQADSVHMIEDMWISGGPLASGYRGHARFRELADEILVEMGLEVSRARNP